MSLLLLQGYLVSSELTPRSKSLQLIHNFFKNNQEAVFLPDKKNDDENGVVFLSHSQVDEPVDGLLFVRYVDCSFRLKEPAFFAFNKDGKAVAKFAMFENFTWSVSGDGIVSCHPFNSKNETDDAEWENFLAEVFVAYDHKYGMKNF